MPDRVRSHGRLRLLALVVASALIALSSSAEAAPAECRTRIGKEARALITTGSRFVDVCHKKRDRVCVLGSMRGECNLVESADVDPKGTFVARKAKALARIAADCTPADLVDYAGGVESDVIDSIVEELTGNSQVSLGTDDLLCDKRVVACHRAIAQSRTTVLKEVVNDSVKCQRELDRKATSFGAISPACLDAGERTSGQGASRIVKSCAGVTAEAVGSCSPLPGCVIDSAVATGRALAAAIYAAPSGCGDGDLDAGEQCDDGNRTSGDGCSSSCELEGNTCTPYSPAPPGGTGSRLVTVSISTPEPLAGLQVSVDYPQFQSGIPGVGTSSLVQGRFTPLQPAGLALLNDNTNTDAIVGMVNVVDLFNPGPLFRISFDNCVQLSQGICNRNQNVFGCGGRCRLPDGSGGSGAVCFDDSSCTVGEICDAGDPLVCSPGVNLPFGPGPQAGCCPGDNSCVAQDAITSCAISDPVDALGQPVAGVTCSVSVTEVP